MRRIVGCRCASSGLGHAARVAAGIIRGGFDGRGRKRLRCVGKQLSRVVRHRLIGIDDPVRLRKWRDHVTSQPARRHFVDTMSRAHSIVPPEKSNRKQGVSYQAECPRDAAAAQAPQGRTTSSLMTVAVSWVSISACPGCSMVKVNTCSLPPGLISNSCMGELCTCSSSAASLVTRNSIF